MPWLFLLSQRTKITDVRVIIFFLLVVVVSDFEVSQNWSFKLQQPFKYSDNLSPETLEIYFKFFHSWLLSYVSAGNLPALADHPRAASSGRSQCLHPWLSLYTEGTGTGLCSDLSIGDRPEIVAVLTGAQTLESVKASSCRSNTSYYLFCALTRLLGWSRKLCSFKHTLFI